MAMDKLMRMAQRLLPNRPAPESAWRPPVTLDRGALGEAWVSLNAKGQGAALWENNGKLWTLPVGPTSARALARLPVGEGTSPQLLMNAAGRGIALWRSSHAGSQSLLAKALGAGLDSELCIFQTQGQIHNLQAAVDRRGNALVVWLHEREGMLEVMAQSYDARAGAWKQDPSTLGFPSSTSAEPRIAMNHREHAMVLWEAESGGNLGLVASHYWPADGIWSDRPVPVVDHATRQHRVVMDDQGHALAIWIHAPYGQRCSLQASRFQGQRCEWGEPEILSSAYAISQPQLVMTGTGDALAAWCQAEDRGATRLVAKSFAKGRWRVGVECLDLGHEPVREFALDLGADGQAGLVAVHRGTDGDWVSARRRSGEWSPTERLIPPSPQVCAAPQLRLCPQGASALWTQGLGQNRALILAETR